MVLNSGCHWAGRHLSRLLVFNPFATCLTCFPSEYPAFSHIASFFFFFPMPFIVFGSANSWFGWNDTTRGQLRELSHSLMRNSEGLMRSHCRQSWQQLTGSGSLFQSELKSNCDCAEMSYATPVSHHLRVCVRGRVCACACKLRTRAQGRHLAAYSAAVCHSDREALFALITTGTFLEFRVRSRRKWLGIHSESIDTERRKYHTSVCDMRFNYMIWVSL